MVSNIRGVLLETGSPNRVVSIVIRLKAGRSGVRIPAWDMTFLFSRMPIEALGPTQPPIQRVLEFFPGGKVVNYSPATTAKVGRSDTCTSTTFLHGTKSHRFIYLLPLLQVSLWRTYVRMVYVMANNFNKTNVLFTGKEGTGEVTDSVRVW